MTVEKISRWLSKFASFTRRDDRVAISVQRSVQVGQKATATILEVNGELLLLGVTNSNVTLIQRWDRASKDTWAVRGVVR